MFSMRFISQTVASAILTMFIIYACKKTNIPFLSKVANEV